MNPSIRPLAAAAVLACAAAAAPSASAHDIVLVPERGTLVLRYGHAGDWQVLEPRRLVELQTLDAAAAVAPQTVAQPELKPRGKDKEMVLTLAQAPSAAARLFAARYDNGLWARVPQAEGAKPLVRNTTRAMLPNATLVTNNQKYAKAWAGPASDTELFKKPVGHLLELVPMTNPLAAKAGDMLEVKVLLRGEPLAGAGIEVGDLKTAIEEDRIQRYTTDAQGIARVPLRAKGVHMLAVDTELGDGTAPDLVRASGADKLVLVATYTFVR
jgi:nickel transport protein